MKIKTLIAAVTLSMALASCSKDDDNYTPQPISGVSVYHASPTTEKLDFYVGTNKANQADFAFGNKIEYLNVYSGERQVTIKKKGAEASVVTEKLTFEPQTGYSLFVADKFDALKFLLLKDDLTKPAASKARVRFINLSPDAPALNLSIAGKDTDLFTNKLFKEYSTFETIDAADKVTFNVKNTTGGALATSIADVKIESGKIYTIWVKGLVAATDDTKIGVVVSEHKL
ncbi:DUF4397 domain-containing protein [Pedobacter frigoris]|uniref:DUF4397 domain-containing protein n=1 Tax=Pedobacter frigoris TaxID=2571272 RepID=A0A4U1CED4_9SPHI|nr:DUF4397 domain-containing protein [Pedobacter frigoris]TKC04891.1 DUF4397 domain-containing protein [Pedobacter frigoris]